MRKGYQGMRKGYLSKRIKVFIIIVALVGCSALAWGARGEYYGYDDDVSNIGCEICITCDCLHDECDESCLALVGHQHDGIECDCDAIEIIASVPGDDGAIDRSDAEDVEDAEDTEDTEDAEDAEDVDSEDADDEDVDNEDLCEDADIEDLDNEDLDNDDLDNDERGIEEVDDEDTDVEDVDYDDEYEYGEPGDDLDSDDGQGDGELVDNNQPDDDGDDVGGPVENTPNSPLRPPSSGEEAVPQLPVEPQQPLEPLPPRFTPRPSPIDININPVNVIPPSNSFLSMEDRVRFSVDTQIDGLPPFITMEMVVGLLLAQDQYGFPASVGIAQIIQEGGYGSFGPGGEEGLGLSLLSHKYNNLFGIKGTGPAGSVNLNTFEMTPAGDIWFAEYGFRVYHTHTESIMDRSRLLQEVYSDLYYGVTNANEFAWNIGGRWATDINYASSLIRHMINYDLYRLDEMTLQDYNELIGVGRFVHPVPGSVITSPFGFRTFDNSFHRGIDFGTGAHNLPIFAAESGEVIFVGYGIAEGNWIIIDHGDGLYTMYMHNYANFVEVGQEVHRGQQIGLTGTTGNSTGNHLHFQVERNGMAIDPAVLLGFYRID